MRNYDPRYTNGETTFLTDVEIPAILKPRVAVEETLALSVRLNLRLALGMVRNFVAKDTDAIRLTIHLLRFETVGAVTVSYIDLRRITGLPRHRRILFCTFRRVGHVRIFTVIHCVSSRSILRIAKSFASQSVHSA